MSTIIGHEANLGQNRGNRNTMIWLFLLCLFGASMFFATFQNLSGIFHDSKTDRMPSLALAFYQHHYQQMRDLINESSALCWGNRDVPIEFAHLYSFFSPPQNNSTSNTSSENAIYHVPVDDRYNQPHPSFFQHGPYIHRDNLCMMARAFEVYNNHSTSENSTHYESQQNDNETINSQVLWPRRPHVLFTQLNENWGAFSEEIVNKTVGWVHDLRASWMNYQCSEEQILQYLNHPDMKAVVTIQHQILSHPKVLSLPVGVLYHGSVMHLLHFLLDHPPKHSNYSGISSFSSNNLNTTKQLMNATIQDTRPQLLMMSTAETPTRTPVHNFIIREFAKEGIEIKNTYGNDYSHYVNELRHSKFILSPSGMGMDCYRNWEAMIMGTIPVIEHLNRTETDGWYRTLQDLPVALIDSYDNLTPQWLEKEYRHIVSRPHSSYNFEKLTTTWWVNQIQSMLHG